MDLVVLCWHACCSVNTTLAHGRKAQKHRQTLHSVQGWDWQNDGSEDRPKWGYVSWKAGDKLLMQVPCVSRTHVPLDVGFTDMSHVLKKSDMSSN